ncbi:metallophosphoesterase [Sphingomonas sp. J315]|uniref:metallophosphoesterase n=1 Tax=Sphingomonas sp. J315 TaxID=2898433 RepID=UPI0021ADF165|nr:metallophosphoesterase [Sphingomonas sp. J315]UUX98477.1 metallophosphoesterase [Sphingomonas sp. J315]
MGALRDPTVRTATIAMADWPKGQPPLRVALLSDLHVAGPDMPPERLARIVTQVNALRPDLVLIAGDLVSDKRVSTHRYAETEAVAPLGGLRARHGVVAVLGNHDHWRNTAGMRRALEANRVTVLSNSVTRRAGLILAGADDDFTGRADPAALIRAVAPLTGPVVTLSHSPDIVPDLPERFGLVLAGHTHCGQVALPLIGRPATMSRYGDRFACGLIREGARTIVVGAGLGTSVLPIRIGAPPDLWLIELTAPAAPATAAAAR